jgi:hypothetical protein
MLTATVRASYEPSPAWVNVAAPFATSAC